MRGLPSTDGSPLHVRARPRRQNRPQPVKLRFVISNGVGPEPIEGVVMRWIAMLLMAAALSGCGVVAAPCRVGSAVIKAVPLVGHVAAAPTDACADVIDPDSITKS